MYILQIISDLPDMVEEQHIYSAIPTWGTSDKNTCCSLTVLLQLEIHWRQPPHPPTTPPHNTPPFDMQCSKDPWVSLGKRLLLCPPHPQKQTLPEGDKKGPVKFTVLSWGQSKAGSWSPAGEKVGYGPL